MNNIYTTANANFKQDFTYFAKLMDSALNNP